MSEAGARLLKFDETKISDQKRLVRGEQLLLARSLLRIRDEQHQRPWRVLMMAGAAPNGEIQAIRELMPKSHIVAVDRDAACLEAAIEAGADDVILCDLSDFSRKPYAHESYGHQGAYYPAQPIMDIEKFDLMHLDFCAGAQTVGAIAMRYRIRLVARAVMVVTFSYGRDVKEVFADLADDEAVPAWLKAAAPPMMCGRLRYVFGATHLEYLHSVMVYRGASMPMCSALFQFRRVPKKPSYVQIEPGDFELAVTLPDPVKLYDCPQTRIESLRRTHTAIKAQYTRKAPLLDVLS